MERPNSGRFVRMLSDWDEAAEPEDEGWRARIKRLPRSSDWLALLLGPAVSVPFAACYAALVCRNPVLAPHFPVILQQIMWTQMMGSIISLFVGQFVTTTNLDPLSAILFGQLSQRIVIHFQGPDAHLLLSNMMLVMPLMTICLGFGLYAVGRFRMAFMLRFFPYTVVAGFLAGSGILILVESLALASGPSIFKLMTDSVMLGLQSLQVEPALGREDSWQTFLELLSNWSQIGCAVLFSFLAGAVRDLHTFGTPCLLACCIGLSLAVEFMSGGTLPPKSWFLAFPEPVHWWEPFQVMGQALSGDFRPTMAIDAEFTATFVTIMTVAWSINTLAVAKLVPLRPGLKRCEEQDEIQSLGLTNIILGSLGCHSSMQSFKLPMMMRGVKSGPLWPYFNLMVNIYLFFYSPRAIILSVPRFLFAGSVVRLSLDLISEWLLEARSRVALAEWYVIAATAFLVVLNVSIGIIFGLFLTLVLFAVEYSGVTGVVRSASLKEARSNVERSEEENQLLYENGQSGLVLWLSGYLFFGSATQLADEVRASLEKSLVPITVVVLDFSHVPAMDASGVYAIVDLSTELHDARCTLVLCGFTRRLQMAVTAATEHHEASGLPVLYHDLDEALEKCEDRLLKSLARKERKSHTHSMSKIDSLNCISTFVGDELDWDDLNDVTSHLGAAIWENLLVRELRELDQAHLAVACLEQLAGKPREFKEGKVILQKGQIATEFFVLVQGFLEVTRPPALGTVSEKRMPRHHLNAEKGDVFVFEEPRHHRVRRARKGAIFGSVEYAACCSVLPTVASSDNARALQRGREKTAGHRTSNGLFRSSGVLECPAWHSTATAVGGSAKCLVISFEALWQAERREPTLALVLRTWLSRISADALLSDASSTDTQASNSSFRPRPIPEGDGTDSPLSFKH